MRPPLLLLLIALAACQVRHPHRITVAVATDLAPWANANADRLSAALGGRVTLVPGPSGQLVAQQLAGAPYDLILAADAAPLAPLPESGPCRRATQRSFATGSLGIILAATVARPPSVATLASDAVSTIAIANPKHAPYGALAWRYLASLPESARLAPKFVYANSAGDAASLLEQGAADAAVTAWSLATSLPEARRHRIASPGVALAATGIVCGTDRALDANWAALTAAPWLQASLAEAGFGPPP